MRRCFILSIPYKLPHQRRTLVNEGRVDLHQIRSIRVSSPPNFEEIAISPLAIPDLTKVPY